MTTLWRVVVLVLALAPVACARTFYVDPDTGSNTQDGTNPATPWETPPGTRNAGNSGWKTLVYEAGASDISTTNRIACGDTILLKGGTTHDATDGGAWRFDQGANASGDGFYPTNCDAGAPVTVRVATAGEWTGSTGNFTLDGTGISPTFLRDSGVQALIHIQDVENMTVGGVSATQRLIVSNSLEAGIVGYSSSGGVCPSCATQFDKLRVQWFEVATAGDRGVTLLGARNSVVKQGVIHDTFGQGINTGYANDYRTTDVGIEDVEVYNAGPANQVPPFDSDAFFFLGCESCWCVRCTARDNYYRGTNAGEVGGGFPMFVTLRDSRYYDNGRTLQNNAIWQGGPCGSGDDIDGGNRHWLLSVGSIFFHNREGGGLCGYGEGSVEIWNSVFYRNGYDTAVTTSGNDIDVGDNDGYGIFNVIIQRSGQTPIGTGAPNGGGSYDCPVSDNNLYRPVSANTENLSGFGCSGGILVGGPYNFTNYASAGWFGANEQIGLAKVINFVALDPSVYASNDFHVTAGSNAIDAGACMFRAVGGGTGTTITSLAAKGNLNDPRRFILSPTSYLDAVPDQLVIGTDIVTVTALTATSISFTPSITWADGDCIHPRQYAGSNTTVDIGAFGFDAIGGTTTTTTTTSTTTTAAPTTSTTSTTSTTGGPTTTTTLPLFVPTNRAIKRGDFPVLITLPPYAAPRDGSNVTAIFEAALAANHTVEVPAGDYTVCGLDLAQQSDQVLVCAPGARLLPTAGCTDTVQLTAAASAFANILLRGCTVVAGTASAVRIDGPTATDVRLEDVTLVGTGTALGVSADTMTGLTLTALRCATTLVADCVTVSAITGLVCDGFPCGPVAPVACATASPGRRFFDVTIMRPCFCNGQSTPRYCRDDTGSCGASPNDCN